MRISSALCYQKKVNLVQKTPTEVYSYLLPKNFYEKLEPVYAAPTDRESLPKFEPKRSNSL
jgi:hypothetical protein